MRLKLLSILGLALLFTACSNDEDYLFKEFEKTESTRSIEATTLAYPLSSFITTVSLTSSDEARLNEILDFMQTTLGNGYNPLFKKLKSSPIAKIYRGTTDGTAPAAYNPTSNVIILKTGATITDNMLEEELVHAGQNRVYSGGIAKYAKTAGTPNIEFEAKLTQDLISYVNDGPFSLGAGPNNIDEYTAWVMSICGDTETPKFPSMPTVLTVKEGTWGYYQMVDAFKTKAAQYNYPVLTTLKPLYINYTYINYGL